MISALRMARLSVFPNVTLKRCFWHLIHQEFSKIFGNGEHDREVNTVVRGWFNSLAYQVETRADFKESMDAEGVDCRSRGCIAHAPQKERPCADFAHGAHASVRIYCGSSEEMLGKVLQSGLV